MPRFDFILDITIYILIIPTINQQTALRGKQCQCMNLNVKVAM